MTEFFVHKSSVVRKIWGRADTVLLIFAASAAEFSLHKNVDWLFFTGKIPNSPLKRMFSTVEYASKILFEEKEKAHAIIKAVREIHGSLEYARGLNIPDAAYRDILYMLIDYSIKSYVLIFGQISERDKTEVYEVFYRFGLEMQIPGLPKNYSYWKTEREITLKQNFECSAFSIELQQAYKKNLGSFRFWVLVEIQKLLLDSQLLNLLELKNKSLLKFPFIIFKTIKNSRFASFLIIQFMPKEFRNSIKKINNN